jgi:OmpA family
MKRAMIAGCVGWLICTHGALGQAGPLELGGWLGPRLFSDNSRLGQHRVTAPGTLTNALTLGGRIGRPLWNGVLVPELELAIASTQTTPYAVGVFWFEPRVALRWQFWRTRTVRPFVVIGGGAPVSLSGNTDVFANHVVGEGFVGGGAALWTGKGFALRLDARLTMLPGKDPKVTVEGELGVGILVPIGPRPRTSARERLELVDRDHDGIPDGKDACADRPEDLDGVEDQDGCPDIDNDLDHILDIADACPLQPETYNGIADDDGCPDSVPPELAAVLGPITAATFPVGDRAPARSGAATAMFDRIAKALMATPNVRVRLIGHADNQEVAPPADADPADPGTAATELGLARATTIRELLIARGVPEERLTVESHGSDDPTEDNSTVAGRQANRRVEVQLFIIAH